MFYVGAPNFTISAEDSEAAAQTVFSEHSSVNGIFLIFTSLDPTEVTDLENAKYLALDKNASHNFTLPFSLSAGRTIILLYIIERDGKLASGVNYPVVMTELAAERNTTPGKDIATVESPKSGEKYLVNFQWLCWHAYIGLSLQLFQRLLENCLAYPVQAGVKVECSFLPDSSATGFQVIVHSRDEIQKLYVTETQNQAQAIVLVEESGLYQVVVFSIRGESGIVGSLVEYQKQLIVENAPEISTIGMLVIHTVISLKPECLSESLVFNTS